MPSVDLLFLEVTLSPSASMLEIIVLLESIYAPLGNFARQKGTNALSKVSVYLVAVSIPVKMTTAVEPLADIPP